MVKFSIQIADTVYMLIAIFKHNFVDFQQAYHIKANFHALYQQNRTYFQKEARHISAMDDKQKSFQDLQQYNNIINNFFLTCTVTFIQHTSILSKNVVTLYMNTTFLSMYQSHRRRGYFCPPLPLFWQKFRESLIFSMKITIVHLAKRYMGKPNYLSFFLFFSLVMLLGLKT